MTNNTDPHDLGAALGPQEMQVFARKLRKALEALERAIGDPRLEHSDMRVLTYLVVRRCLTPVWDSTEVAVVPALRAHRYETANDIARETTLGRTSVTRSIQRLQASDHIDVDMRGNRSWIAVLNPLLPGSAVSAKDVK